MAVAFRCAGGNGSGATAQTSYVVNKPTSPAAVQDGDVMYCFLSFVQSGTITPPAGWTSIAGPQNAPSGSMRHQLFRKVASAEPTTWTFTNSVSAKWYAEVWVGSGIDNTTPEYSATITSMSGAAPFVTAGVAPNATNDAWGVYMCGADCSVALSWSTDQTDRHTANSGSGTSNLNGGSADTNGILSGTEAAAFTPSPLSLQGGAMASFGVNAGPTIEAFTSSTTWTCPAGVTTATIRCWGGGGAGGGGSVSGAAGGGGAGGSFATSSISVTPGNNYTVTVGAGGSPDTTPSTNGATHPGGDSWFGTTGTVLAQGGAGGGDRSTSGNGTAGSGSTASSVGTTLYAGGSGAAGSSGSIGGGGGGGAGTTGAGGSASGSTAGSGTPFFGGAGSAGTSAANASNATLYGGGGGGARATSNTDRIGGAGADGRVEVEYVVATSVSANAGAAAATGSAKTPAITDTVSVAGGGPALVTASAKTPTTTLTCSPVAGVAQATATAQTPTLTAASNIPAGAAAATGSAKDPSVSTATATSANAGVATATATANAPTPTLTCSPTAGVATVTATGNSASITSSASAPVGAAAAVGSAKDIGSAISVPIAYFGNGSGALAGGQNLTVSTPASIPAGGVMVLSVGGFTSSATPTPSGGGWTLVDGGTSSSGGLWTWYKVAAGGEGTITVTMDGSNDIFGIGVLAVFTGCDAANPLGAHSANKWGGVDHSSLTSPSVNNTGAGVECAVFSGAFYNGSTTKGQSTPTNMVEALDYGDNNEGSGFIDYRLNAPTGSQSYSTTSSGQLDWYGGASLLFLLPAVGKTANAGAATASCSALAPTITDATSVAAGAASATAAANAPTITDTVSVTAGFAAATAVAGDPTVTVQSSASADAGSAEATAVAADPSLTLALSITPDEAAATADAYGTTITDSDSVPTDTAQAVGAANSPTLTLTSGGSPDAAEVTAEALSPTVSTASMTNAPAGLVEVETDATGPMMTGMAAATVEAGDLVPPNAVFVDATPAPVRCAASGVDFDIFLPDEVVATVNALDAVGQVEVTVDAGIAETTAEVGEVASAAESTGFIDPAIQIAVSVSNPMVVSTTNPGPSKATAIAAAYAPTPRIGAGLSVTADIQAVAHDATVHTQGGTSDKVRVLRVGLTAERTYTIPHESRVKDVRPT